MSTKSLMLGRSVVADFVGAGGLHSLADPAPSRARSRDLSRETWCERSSTIERSRESRAQWQRWRLALKLRGRSKLRPDERKACEAANELLDILLRVLLGSLYTSLSSTTCASMRAASGRALCPLSTSLHFTSLRGCPRESPGLHSASCRLR